MGSKKDMYLLLAEKRQSEGSIQCWIIIIPSDASMWSMPNPALDFAFPLPTMKAPLSSSLILSNCNEVSTSIIFFFFDFVLNFLLIHSTEGGFETFLLLSWLLAKLEEQN